MSSKGGGSDQCGGGASGKIPKLTVPIADIIVEYGRSGAVHGTDVRVGVEQVAHIFHAACVPRGNQAVYMYGARVEKARASCEEGSDLE